MRRKVLVSLLCSLSLALAGCEKCAATQSITNTSHESGQAKFDVCGLIEKKEIEAIQRSPIKETKRSARSEGDLRISQIFYTAAESNRSRQPGTHIKEYRSADQTQSKRFLEGDF
jgi:hypothetical protein